MLVRTAPFVLAASLVACVADLHESTEAFQLDEARDTTRFEIPAIDPATCRGGQGPKLFQGGKATWTLMVYEAVDNNLQPYAEHDMQQMRDGHDGEGSVNVVLEFDKECPDGRTRYEVTADDSGELEPVEFSPEEPDSGNAMTLASFGAWAVACYPAHNYMLIVGGHGGGYSRQPVKAAAEARGRAVKGKPVVRLIAPDDKNGTEMMIPDLAKALRTVRHHAERPSRYDGTGDVGRLRLYGSDACLMETIETVDGLRNTAQIIIGSEELEPGQGWPYETILREWTRTPDKWARDPAGLASEIVEYFGTSYSSRGTEGFELENTLAAANVDRVQVPGETERVDPITRVRHRMATIATAMRSLLDKDAGFAGHVWAAADASPRFGDVNIDLGVFLVELHQRLTAARKMPRGGERIGTRPEEYRTLRDAIEDLVGPVQLATEGAHVRGGIWPLFVPKSTAGEAYPNAMGISIYMPMELCGSDDLVTYSASPFSVTTGWGGFLVELNARYPHPPVTRYTGTGTMTLESGGGTWQIPIKCNTAGERFDIASNPPEEEEEDGPIDCAARAAEEEEPAGPRSLEMSMRGTMERGGVWLVQAAELYGENPSVDARFVTRLSRRPLIVAGASGPTSPPREGEVREGEVRFPAAPNRESETRETIQATATFKCEAWEPISYCEAAGSPPPGFEGE